MTKTGNGHVRRLLVEAGWHHRTRYRPGAELRRRWDLASTGSPGAGPSRQPAPAHPLESVSTPVKKRAVIANVAIARELAGWCWSLAVMPD